MYQTCIVVGNLGTDPELRYTPNGNAVCSFRMATNERWTDREGQQQEKTTWFRVSVWGRQAETVNQYLTKGRQVLVEGSVDASAWTAQDGTARASLELRARTVRFLGGRGEGSGDFPQGDTGDYRSGGSRGASRPSQAGRGEDWLEDEAPSGRKPPEDDEDIPF